MAPEPADIRKRKALRKGAIAEYRAALALVLKGYRILAFRHRTKLGEIDIIARKGDLVACVEVKARATVESAVSAVSPTAQRNAASARQATSGSPASPTPQGFPSATTSSPSAPGAGPSI